MEACEECQRRLSPMRPRGGSAAAMRLYRIALRSTPWVPSHHLVPKHVHRPIAPPLSHHCGVLLSLISAHLRTGWSGLPYENVS